MVEKSLRRIIIIMGKVIYRMKKLNCLRNKVIGNFIGKFLNIINHKPA